MGRYRFFLDIGFFDPGEIIGRANPAAPLTSIHRQQRFVVEVTARDSVHGLGTITSPAEGMNSSSSATRTSRAVRASINSEASRSSELAIRRLLWHIPGDSLGRGLRVG
jgi:hypothetical protein